MRTGDSEVAERLWELRHSGESARAAVDARGGDQWKAPERWDERGESAGVARSFAGKLWFLRRTVEAVGVRVT